MNTASSRRQRGVLVFLRDLAIIILIALTLSTLVRTFLVRSFYIPSSSMENTLQIDDRILVNQLVPNVQDLQRGDIVVFEDPGGWLTPRAASTTPSPLQWFLELVGLSATDSGEHLVKRVIGLPGDTVECCSPLGKILVNGEPVDEPYLKLPSSDSPASAIDFKVTVPEGSLWVMGDNRNASADSRYNRDKPGDGFVPIENVVGTAFMINWPLNHFTIFNSRADLFHDK
ncbi:signal peptidase I [Lysinibacter sp. HNR]|uniref:signal peptidase I n=1 Tax=Lysinibacter sp. HNR TaxID=3031408 RepID=UPI002435B67B|nr:signal peptidase I [Lysinibacter sp. HNR]WGD38417.1 signal peptidase I [Lysinibacter sp. HNR]